MKKVVLGSLIAASVATSISVEAGVIRHDRNDADYLALGSQSQYDAVGRLLYSTNGGNYICSGTLIDSSYVLTAAHCLDDASTTNVNFTVGGNTYSGSEWTVHNNWFGDLIAGNDIAVLELNGSVNNVAAASRYNGSSEVGNIGTHVGYGATGTGLHGSTLPPGTRRAGHNEMDAVEVGVGHTNIIWNDFDAPIGTQPNQGTGLHPDPNYLANPFLSFGVPSNTALDLEYMIGGGDSGGGYFLEDNGNWFLAGVHSFGYGIDQSGPNSSYGDLSGSTRVSAFNNWIDDAMLALGSNNNVNVSEPGTLALLSMGLAFVGLRRRKA